MGNNREKAKDRRREKILAAARALIRDTGDMGLSMRALADAAEVSLATPYNLFGSKEAILRAVLDSDLDAYRRRLAGLKGDPIDNLVEAIALARKVFAEEPSFYRAIFLATSSRGARELRAMFHGPRYAFWRNLVTSAIAGGFLRAETDPQAFTGHLTHVFASSLLDWVLDELTLDEMESSIRYGFALALLAMATPASAARLTDLLERSQRRIKRTRGKSTAATAKT